VRKIIVGAFLSLDGIMQFVPTRCRETHVTSSRASGYPVTGATYPMRAGRRGTRAMRAVVGPRSV